MDIPKTVLKDPPLMRMLIDCMNDQFMDEYEECKICTKEEDELEDINTISATGCLIETKEEV